MQLNSSFGAVDSCVGVTVKSSEIVEVQEAAPRRLRACPEVEAVREEFLGRLDAAGLSSSYFSSVR